MDEQRIAQYAELIQKLLACADGEELEMLEANVELLDAGLLAVMAAYSQYLRSQGQENNANWLKQFAQHLQPAIREMGGSDNAESVETLNEQIRQLYQQGQYAAAIPLLPEGMKGVLLAQDIAALDLWGNELSALIACQTGLGEVASGEGVFGLRRAFVVAGSKTLIMSLWSVPALATAYLMERLFHHLEEGLGRAAALAHAQSDVCTVTDGELRQSALGQSILQEIRGNYADEDRPLSHPYYWGAWVCQGDIGQLAINQ